MITENELFKLNQDILPMSWSESIPIVCNKTGMNLRNSLFHAAMVARSHPTSKLALSCPFSVADINTIWISILDDIKKGQYLNISR